MITALLTTLTVAQAATAPAVIPFRIGDSAMIVDATINGRNVSCMFDTGFSGAFVLNDSFSVGEPTGTMTLRDFVGSFQAKTVAIKDLKLGNKVIQSEGMEVVQQPMAHMSLSYNTHTDGIMGIEVFKNYVLEINFEKKQMVAHPKTSDPISKLKADGKKKVLLKMLPMGHNSVELPVTAPNGEMMVLALDTGNAFYATTHTDVLERVGIRQKGVAPTFMRTAFVASGPVPSFYQYIDDVTIFGVPVKGSVWSIINMPSSDASHDGTIGFGFLKNFNIWIDMGRRRVFLDNFTGKTTDPVKADIGISAFFDEESKRYIVTNVTPGGPAEKAGVKRLDALLAIDGKELLDGGQRQLASLFEGDQGTKVKVATSRAGNLIRYELTREYLINDMKKN